jgi:hypothetical protein
LPLNFFRIFLERLETLRSHKSPRSIFSPFFSALHLTINLAGLLPERFIAHILFITCKGSLSGCSTILIPSFARILVYLHCISSASFPNCLGVDWPCERRLSPQISTKAKFRFIVKLPFQVSPARAALSVHCSLSIVMNGPILGNFNDPAPIYEQSKRAKGRKRETGNSGPGANCATQPLGEGMLDNDIPAFMATASAGSAGLANGPDVQHVRNLHPSAQ